MGLAALPGEAPALAPGGPTVALEGAALGLKALVSGWSRGAGDPLDAAALAGERAALGAPAPGGSVRLMRAADAWITLNLARAEDRALVPAWLEIPPAEDAWTAATRALRSRPAAAAVARGRWLGLPVAIARPSPIEPFGGCLPERPPAWRRSTVRGPSAPLRPRDAVPVVVDLSSLWAGPLATQLLSRAGARVIKVESCGRPDGARRGPRAFFDLLNAGKQSVVLDFDAPEGRAALRELIETADVVVESARPRALQQLGIHADRWLAARPGRTWISITGYGRARPWGGWVAFGDDAAAAAGWCTVGADGTPRFCGDALADPLTGVHAALAAAADWSCGGGRLIDLSLRDVAAHARIAPVALAAPWHERARVIPPAIRSGRDSGLGWVEVDGCATEIAPPRARSAHASAPPLGAHNESLGMPVARAGADLDGGSRPC